MERRRIVRKDVSLETEFVSGGKNYTGVIGNISEEGAYIKTSITETAIDFLPAIIIELKFPISSEETISLLCEIIWLYSKKIQHPRLEGHALELENNIGIEIKSSPPEYERFVMNL